MPQARPLIALLTDFGTRDWFVAAMKGVIKTITPEAEIVDITHEIEPQNIAEAAFVLSVARASFAEDSIFVAVVDPSVGSTRQPLVVRAHQQLFIAPDNGVLTYVLHEAAYTAHEISNRQYALPEVSSTFHGRDIFAPAAGHLANGVEMPDLGPQLREPPVRLHTRDPEVLQDTIIGQILYIDRFGNAITNITREHAPDQQPKSAVANGKQFPFARTYSDVTEGAALSYWGSTGAMELALNHANAREQLNLRVLHSVEIHFEV